MKFTILALAAALVGTASAGNVDRPIVSFVVKDGNHDGLEGLDPSLTWEGTTESGDIDITYGLEAAIRPTSDIASLPRSIWGKARTEVSGFDVSLRAQVDADNRKKANLEIDGTNDDSDLSFRVLASAGEDFSVGAVEATKGFDVNGARVTVNPRYDVATEKADVVINYDVDNTNVELIANQDEQSVTVEHCIDDTTFKLSASADHQEITVSQQLDDANRIAPTIGSNGEISIEWEHVVNDDSVFTARLKPNDSIDVEWEDQDWTANVNMPIDGTDIRGASVSIRRDVEF